MNIINMECEIEGLVTRIDPYYGYFEVKNKFRIHLSLLKCYNTEIKLPWLNSRVSARHLYKSSISSTKYVACRKTTLEGNLAINFNLTAVTNLYKTHELGPDDIIIIDKTLDLLNKNFIFEAYKKEEIIVGLVENLVRLKGVKILEQEWTCLNSILPDVDVITISACKFIENDPKKFKEFPVWSFGVHPKPKEHSMLFGFLYIHPKYGLFSFKDSSHEMICLLSNKMLLDVSLNHCYVIIRDYRIFTEIFKDGTVLNIEYLMVNLNDISVVCHLEHNTPILSTNSPVQRFNKFLEFTVARKSTICVGSNSKFQVYLEVLAKNNSSQGSSKMFLTLNSNYIPLIMHLKEGFRYRLGHTLDLNKVDNYELNPIDKLDNFELVDSNAHFQELGKVEDLKILTVEECMETISNMSGLFSFEGVIRNRNFVSSRFNQPNLRTGLYGFVTPGSDTHTVIFTCDKYKDKNIVLYLSSWANKLIPLGLVPEMRVIVRHVQSKRSYVTHTIFTSIEIVSYEPRVQFRTASMFTHHEYDWGMPFYLSLGNDIPHCVIVWSKVQNIHILEMRKSISSQDANMEFTLILHAYDGRGVSKVTVKNVNFLRLVLDLNETQFSTWLQAFQAIGEYNFNIHDIYSSEMTIRSEPHIFIHILTQLILQFNKTECEPIEMKCRKQFMGKNTKENEHPHWFYLDARRIFK